MSDYRPVFVYSSDLSWHGKIRVRFERQVTDASPCVRSYERSPSDARTAEGKAVRIAASEWRSGLPADPVRRASELLRQAVIERERRRALVLEAAKLAASTSDTMHLESAIHDRDAIEDHCDLLMRSLDVLGIEYDVSEILSEAADAA